MHPSSSHPAAAMLAACCLLAAAPSPSQAAGDVSPGTTLTFTTPDYGTRECRMGASTFITCLSGAFVGTGWNVSERKVSALVLRPAGPTAIFLPTAYAKGLLHNEFNLLGTAGHFVNAQVRVDYDIDPAQIAMVANAYASVTVSLEVRDITSSPGFTVTSHQLYELRRDNTQGFTDVAGMHERQIRPGETGHFQVMLLTGRKYALSFVVETMTGAFFGGGDAHGTAYWNSLSISVDEDEVALIDDLAVAVEQHDQDIKARLDQVDDQLEALKHLIQTPQGRRPSWND